MAAQRVPVGHHQQHPLKSQVYAYNAQRHWFNNEINSFIDDPASANFGQVYRERLAVDHAQRLYGNITDLTINSNIGGMDNRFVATVAASSLQFNVVQERFLAQRHRQSGQPGPRPLWARSDKKFYTHVDNVSLSFEDRLKLTSNFASDRRHPRRGDRTGAHRDSRRTASFVATGVIRSPRPSIPSPAAPAIPGRRCRE